MLAGAKGERGRPAAMIDTQEEGTRPGPPIKYQIGEVKEGA